MSWNEDIDTNCSITGDMPGGFLLVGDGEYLLIDDNGGRLIIDANIWDEDNNTNC